MRNHFLPLLLRREMSGFQLNITELGDEQILFSAP
jgi:hypothetical protein